MRARPVRIGMVAVVAALLGTTTPPAQAELAFGISFLGQASFSGPGLGYLCTNDTGVAGTTTYGFDPSYLCWESLLGGLLSTLPLPHPEGIVPNGHVHFNHNVHGLSIRFVQSCLGEGASPLKLHTADIGTCGLEGSGTLDGHCGIVGGRLTGTFTITNATGALPQTFVFDLHFNGVGVLVVTGHVFNTNTGQNGKLFGTIALIPPTPAFTSASCFNLTASNFIMVGAFRGYTRNL